MARTLADLVRGGSDPAILPDPSFGFLDRTPSVGRPRDRLSSAQHFASRVSGRTAGRLPTTTRHSGRLARRVPLRAASGNGRVGGVDFGTEKHAIHGFLSR